MRSSEKIIATIRDRPYSIHFKFTDGRVIIIEKINTIFVEKSENQHCLINIIYN